MNMQTPITHTAAEEGLIAALGRVDGVAKDAATKALAEIEKTGLPTRRVEAWHYTDLRNLLRDYPQPPRAIQSEFSSESLVDLPPLVEGYTLGFSNTFHVIGYIADMPEGLSGTVGEEAVTSTHDVPVEADTIGLINAGLAETGVQLTVEAGATLAEPVILAHTCADETASSLRHSVRFAKGAQATFIERHHSSITGNFQSIVCNLVLEKGAKAVWVIDQELGVETTRLGQLNVELAEDADLTILILNAGGKLVRQEVHVAVNGENANLAIKGVNLVGNDSHVDVTTTLTHNVPNTVATELFRNVVPGSGKGVFQGQIRVAQPAQKTDAQMACNTLLLSDEADFSAKPELEIFADDVICAHGATVADIEDEQLFYLRARGIPEREARALLVKAFVEEVFEDIGNEALAEALVDRIESWLDFNG
ncbi:MAG: Fe-S cluster assembly protein SufD [Nitratireductor sp.]|nr:Fe-S cluster assembly protein SufD [Nitratireductor sp.]